MHIIPVIDLYQGQVVHAVRGQREHYQPVRSLLCTGSDPCAIVQAMLNLYPFTTLYIADLDAIQSNKENKDVIDELQQEFPHLAFWLDSGKFRKEDFPDFHHSSTTYVIGSETGVTADMFDKLSAIISEPVLSLDFKAGIFSGEANILQHPEIWPQNIIVMNLARVGSSEGPDMDLLEKIKPLSTGKNIYMAGGIRNIDDLRKLDTSGVAGVLVATALHDGSITGADISSLE